MVIKKMYKKRSQKVGVLFELKKIIQKKSQNRKFLFNSASKLRE